MSREYAFTRPVLNTYLTRERDRKRRRELAWVLLAAVPVGLCALMYVWLHLQVLDTGYRIVRLEEELEQRQQLERDLELERAFLSSPARIEARASSELDLRVADVEQLVFAEELQ